jgi:hypothetical protein
VKEQQSQVANQEMPALEQPPAEVKPPSAQHKDEERPHTESIYNAAPDILADQPAPSLLLPHHSFQANQPARESEKKQDNTRVIEYYDVFLFHNPNPTDTKWVTDLALHLTNKHKFRVWFRQWEMIPGESWQKALAHGLDLAICCAICVGQEGPGGWFSQVIERAKNRQAQDPSFRVIPVLLPSAPDGSLDRFDFLKLNVEADFRETDFDTALHILASGIRGIQPGQRQPPETDATGDTTINRKRLKSEEMLQHLDDLKQKELITDQIKEQYMQITMERVWLPEWLSNAKEDADG